jgi:hypothetical protein
MIQKEATSEGIDEASAREEMESWKKEAAEVVETSDKAILDSHLILHALSLNP